MPELWSRPAGESGAAGADYWEFFGIRLTQHAAIPPGARVLDVGCGTGSSLFPAAGATGPQGSVIGIDLCPG